MDDYTMAGADLISIKQAVTLSRSPSAKVRRRLAANPKCPTSVLEQLSKDSDIEVRVAVGLNHSTPAPVLDRLLSDPCLTVRFHLAGNLRLGEARLKTLRLDRHKRVAQKAYASYEISMLEKQVANLRFSKKKSAPLLGQLLLLAGVLSEHELASALLLGRKQQLKLGNALLSLRLVPRSILIEALIVQDEIGNSTTSMQEGIKRLKKGSGHGLVLYGNSNRQLAV